MLKLRINIIEKPKTILDFSLAPSEIENILLNKGFKPEVRFISAYKIIPNSGTICTIKNRNYNTISQNKDIVQYNWFYYYLSLECILAFVDKDRDKGEYIYCNKIWAKIVK